MKDSQGRAIQYLRLSVTDQCNLNCRYCNPEGNAIHNGNPLTPAELEAIAATGVRLGLTKLRMTGGEPLLRPDILEITRRLASISGIEELAMTTNGLLLADMAEPLRQAGLMRVNVSLDSLCPERFRTLTGGGDLAAILRGMDAAEQAGLIPMKLNAVLMGGINEEEIPDFVALTRHRPIIVRFIELMPTGEGARFATERFVHGDAVLRACPDLVPAPDYFQGVARVYQLPNAVGKVGLVRPMSRHFCRQCNRIRVTADGNLKPCLHHEAELPLRGLTGETLAATLRQGIMSKPEGHIMTPHRPSGAGRNMHRIGG